MSKPVSHLFREFEKMEAQRRQLLADLSSFSEEQLRMHPQAGSWSRIDVLDHLVKTEESIVAEVQKNLPRAIPVSASNRVRATMLIGVMRSPMRVKVPKGVEFVLPDSEVSLQSAIRRWDAIRADLRSLLEGIGPRQIKLGSFEHPVSGWMDVLGMMSFLRAHLRHHEYQLARLNSR